MAACAGTMAAALLLWLAAVGSVSSAQAAPARLVGDEPFVQLIAVDGERTLWIAKGRLYLRSGAGSARVVGVVESDNEGDGDTYLAGSDVLRLEASGSRALIVVHAYDESAKLDPGGYHAFTQFIDLASGKATSVESCSTGTTGALTGAFVITNGCAAESGARPGPVRLHNLDTGQPPVRLADGALSVNAAGHRVAWLDARVITVLDTDSGIRRQIDTAPLGTGPIRMWELAPDGAVAFVIGDDVWHATADGAPPRLLGRPGSVHNLAIADGSVVVSVSKMEGLEIERPHELVALALDGKARVLARGGAFRLDADGDRLAYSSMTCLSPAKSSLWSQRTDDQIATTLPGSRCGVPSDDYGRIDRRRRLHWNAACPNPVPARTGERCSITVKARIGHYQLARKVRRSLGNRSKATFKWTLPRRLVDASKMQVTVTTKMRGKTSRSSKTVQIG